MANHAVQNASSSSEEDHEIDPKNANIDEKRFMKTMLRHDIYEQLDLEEREDREKKEKKKKAYEIKKKIFL